MKNSYALILLVAATTAYGQINNPISSLNDLTVRSLTTSEPVTWVLDAMQTNSAPPTSSTLTLPNNANVVRLTNNNTGSGFNYSIQRIANGRLGAFYYLINQSDYPITINNTNGITIQGGTPLTLGVNQAATLVATGATNASVAARGDLNDVALGGTANTAPSQTASSGSSLMTRDLGDVRYPKIQQLITSVFDLPLDNVAGTNSGINGFITGDGGFRSTAYTGSGGGTNSFAAWGSEFASGAVNSGAGLTPLRGYGVSARITMPYPPDTFVRFLVGGLASRSDITLGTLTTNGFGVELSRSLAGTTNQSVQMRVIYNNNTTTTVGSWVNIGDPSRVLFWVINTGTHIRGYYQLQGINLVPTQNLIALPAVSTALDHFISINGPKFTFQTVDVGGTATFNYADITDLKQTFGIYPE